MNRTRSKAFVMPDRMNFMLGAGVLALLAIYIALMITTIFFAAWQTQLASTIDDTRARIHTLETQYYDAIARIDSTDPYAVGLVSPEKVEYVVAARMPGLTLNR